MATLVTPIMDLVGTFDALYPYVFTFSYSGESIIKSRLVIKNNETLEVVYDRTQDGMRLSHTLSGNLLTNDAEYLVQVQIFDANGNFSNLSEVVAFSCHTTPTFELIGVTNKATISGANVPLSILFQQAEGDVLDECAFQLYDENKSLLQTSGSLYGQTSYTLTGLANHTKYYFAAIGKSKFGFNLTTEYYEVYTNFNVTDPNISIALSNKNGRIAIETNIKSMGYDVIGDVELVDDEMVVGEDSSIIYQFKTTEDDFMLLLKGHDLPKGEISTIHYASGKIVLSVVDLYGAILAKLQILDEDGKTKYVLYEDIVGATLGTENGSLAEYNGTIIKVANGQAYQTTTITFVIKRENGLYSLSAMYV